MVSVGDKALLFRNRDMMWLEESGSPSVGDKGFLVRNEDGNFFLKGTSVSVGNKGRLFNINGVNYLRSVISGLGKFKWRINCSNKVHGIKVTSDGTIFAGTEWGTTNGAIWAINSDGTLKWCNNDYILPTDYPDYFTDIVISNDETKLFVGDGDAYLRSFHIANGTEVWNWSDPHGAVSTDFWGGLVIDDNDNIYGGGRSGVASVDKDGNFRWDNKTVCEMDYHLAVDNDQLYVPQICSQYGAGYCALDINSGQVNWITGIEHGYAVEYYNNRIYYGTFDELDCVTTGGGLIYRYSPIDVEIEDIIVDSNDNCYFFENRGGYPNYSTCIKKLDSNGILIWTKNMTRQHCLHFGPQSMVIDSDNLYVATEEWQLDTGNAVSIKLSDGTENWTYPLTYDSESSGALSPSKDTVYFGSGQYVYALET